MIPSYKWRVVSATLAPRQPDDESPQLDEALNDLDSDFWEIFAVVPDPATKNRCFNRVRVVARREMGTTS